VIDRIKTAFEPLPSGPDKEWSNEIKKRFINLGLKEGYRVHSTLGENLGQAGGEWLYDLTWLKYDQHRDVSVDYEHLQEVVLAMESEWGNVSAVIDDFHKLLQSTAKYRVLSFQSKTPAAFLNYARTNIGIYPHIPGSCFLLACYSESERRFLFEVITP
jgi:hypothetical protein